LSLMCRRMAYLATLNFFVILLFLLLLSGCNLAGSDDSAVDLDDNAGDQKEEPQAEKSSEDQVIPDPEDLELADGEIVLEQWQPLRIIIPSIDLNLEVASDRDTYDQEEIGKKPWEFSTEEYEQWLEGLMPLLSDSPVHYQFSSLPGITEGNVAIAGHSPGPWYHFYDLDQLENGDEIFLGTKEYLFVYQVKWDKIVDKYDWSPLYDTDYPALTLQTCHPKDYEGFDHPERLMIRAELDEIYEIPEQDEE